MRVGSTFSGIGGFELAALAAGMKIAWSCEINNDARSVLSHHFPTTKLHGDIAEIGLHNVDRIDLLCGGFPCQDLSVAGKRAGLAGERSGLFYEFARLAAELRPTWIILENVAGLLSSQRGRDMGIVIGTLGDLGYGLAWRVLDAQNFGVPQRRRRVVIVGHLGDVNRAGQVLFEPESSSGDTPQGEEPRARVAGTIAASAGTGGLAGIGQSANSITSRLVEGQRSVVAALTANGVGTCGADDNQGQAGHLIADTLRSHPRPGSNSVGAIAVVPSVSHALCANRGQRNDPNEQTFIPVAFSENQRAEVVESDYAHALSTGGGKPGVGYPAIRQELAVRRLTPLECERLQGFPDVWTDVPNAKGRPMADSARYRMLGNAIAVPVFHWVFDRVAQVDAA